MDDDNKIYGPNQLRVFKTQLALSVFIGVSTFLLFCFLRRRWPHLYAVRTLRKSLIYNRRLPNNLFKWVPAVLRISEDELLECSGLDAYVVLAFFKMGVATFLLLLLIALLVLSPVRYYFTGNYDQDGVSWLDVQLRDTASRLGKGDPPSLHEDFPRYLWVYPLFTYCFSIIVYVNLFRFTKMVIKTRQKYLASQNSITDRTIRIDGIPKKIIRRNDPVVLKKFIEDLGIGRVEHVKLIYDWEPLEVLFDKRKELIQTLELLYARYYDLRIDLYNESLPRVLPKNAPDLPVVESRRKKKLRNRISEHSQELRKLDDEIQAIRKKYNPSLSTYPVEHGSKVQLLLSAFVTMDSVASAQMAAQTVLDPRVYKLMVTLAPAAKDINWNNLKLSYYEKITKSYMITFLIILSYSAIFFLVTSLSSLIDVKTLIKFWPALGHMVAKSKWLTTFVTGILPPLLFSLMNVSFPYLYRYLTVKQGYALSSEVELSTLLKNFFFIFFILFLVFTITGTLWDYFTSIGDTTRFAAQLAGSLKKLSLFYVDLILLQGLAMFPVKLLQLGEFVILNVLGKLFFKNFFLRTPRDYRFFYYTPPVFDFGLNLPQHILIFIIILIYSVVSTKIVTSGLVYFTLGYFVYKYQLMYSYVHPPHSTGKVWPMIFRRLIFGLIIFQLFMCGTLALEGAILLSVLCTPLFIVTLVVSWNFERFYLPLHDFIALRAIQNPNNFDTEFTDDLLLTLTPLTNNEANGSSESLALKRGPGAEVSHGASGEPEETSLLLEGDFSVSYNAGRIMHQRKISTIDEEREETSDYTHPYLTDPLHGPWIGFEGDYISMVEYRQLEPFMQERALEAGEAEAETDGAEISEVDADATFVARKRVAMLEWE